MPPVAIDPEKSANLYNQIHQDSAYASPSGPLSGADGFGFPISSSSHDDDAIKSLDDILIPSDQPPAYKSASNGLTGFATNTLRGVRNEFFDDDEDNHDDDDDGLGHAVAQVGMLGTGGSRATAREEAVGEDVDPGPSQARRGKLKWFFECEREV